MVDTTLPPVVQAMLAPDFYPHPVEEPIQLVQTHISYVFLTGELVYKLKKAVDFGFLDFSTLEQRKHFCEEELRLNQTGAGRLYLEVVPITQSEDGFALKGNGEAVEYAVKMQQFPQATLLSEQFEKGELSEANVQQLAERVAKFHLETKTNEHVRSYGTVAAIREAFDENYEQTEIYTGAEQSVLTPQTQQQFDETKALTDKFFATQQTLFQKRLDQDKIRACHGDLHLGNICDWKDEILLFDCIEFNEPFRYVDTMYDVAYIMMDLELAGRQDLAQSFIDRYVEVTGDYEGLEVLPLYISRQSYVRAKVISFMLSDPSVSDADKQAASERAARYYTLAWSAMQKKKGAS